MPDTAIGFTLDIEHRGDTAIVRCHGKLVAHFDDVFYKQVKQLLPASKHIVLDLTDLTRMDSMGLGAVVRLYVSARSAGSTLELINLGKQVWMLIKTANLASAFCTVAENNIKFC